MTDFVRVRHFSQYVPHCAIRKIYYSLQHYLFNNSCGIIIKYMWMNWFVFGTPRWKVFWIRGIILLRGVEELVLYVNSYVGETPEVHLQHFFCFHKTISEAKCVLVASEISLIRMTFPSFFIFYSQSMAAKYGFMQIFLLTVRNLLLEWHFKLLYLIILFLSVRVTGNKAEKFHLACVFLLILLVCLFFHIFCCTAPSLSVFVTIFSRKNVNNYVYKISSFYAE